MIKRSIHEFTSHSYWNGQIHIPFIRQSIQVEVTNGLISFIHHGMTYTIALNQVAKVQKDGSVLVALGRKNKYRTLRKPVGLPSHTSIYFVTHKNGSITLGDLERKRVWEDNTPKTTMAQAFQVAFA